MPGARHGDVKEMVFFLDLFGAIDDLQAGRNGSCRICFPARFAAAWRDRAQTRSEPFLARSSPLKEMDTGDPDFAIGRSPEFKASQFWMLRPGEK